VHTVNSLKGFRVTTYSKMVGKPRNTPSAIATHGSLGAVGIEVAHRKVGTPTLTEHHKSVGADSSATVTQKVYLPGCGLEICTPLVEEYEVVAGTFVFPKFEFHGKFLQFYFHKDREICIFANV
jgi:hypothetical protein